jgi:hypothetical protein
LRVFFSNSGDLLLTLVFRTDADTRKPHVEMARLPQVEQGTIANV